MTFQALLKMGLSHEVVLEIIAVFPLSLRHSSIKQIYNYCHGSNVYIRQVRVASLGSANLGGKVLPFTSCFWTTPHNPDLSSSDDIKMITVLSETFLSLRAIFSALGSKCCSTDGQLLSTKPM